MADLETLTTDGLNFSETSDPSTPAAGKLRVYGKTTGLFYITDGGTVVGPLAAAAAAAAPNTYENFITADVTVVNADTWYAGPAVTPASGTYLVIATLVMTSSFNGATSCSLGIGTASPPTSKKVQAYVAAQGQVLTLVGQARVTVNGSETITAYGLSARGSSVASILSNVTSPASQTDDKASSIVAVAITSV